MIEAETRAELIDPALKGAGWGVVDGSRVRREDRPARFLKPGRSGPSGTSGQSRRSTQPLQPARVYHIYNRGNNRENIFREERNYRFFLERYAHHVGPVTDTFAYCLLRNHFHLLVRIRPEAEWPSEVPPSRRFANLFNSYTKAINRTCGRTGSLFEKPFRRIEVTSDRYFAALVCYIHRNPQLHGFATDFRSYPHSLYAALLDARPTRLRRAETLGWFGGRADFEAMHGQDLPGFQNLAGLTGDDDLQFPADP
jgi:putative transposase